MAPTRYDGEFTDKVGGTLAWMCNLATQSTLTSHSRDTRAESGCRNPSNESSYESGYMDPAPFPSASAS